MKFEFFLGDISMRMEGIFTPIITPQLEDGSIDKESYVEVAEFLISSGISKDL